MNERWVCKRCFADNNDTDTVCGNCGLGRGSEVPAEGGETLATAATATDAQPGWRRWLRYWWIPAIVIILGVGYLASARRDGSGLITDGGTVAIEEVRVGDCFNSEDEDEISEVDAQPCTEAHEYELFHIATWDGSSEYPTDDAMSAFVFEECVPAFEEFVGRSYESSQLDFVHLYPVEEGWNAGDREFQCVLVDPGDAELTTSLRGANR